MENEAEAPRTMQEMEETLLLREEGCLKALQLDDAHALRRALAAADRPREPVERRDALRESSPVRAADVDAAELFADDGDDRVPRGAVAVPVLERGRDVVGPRAALEAVDEARRVAERRAAVALDVRISTNIRLAVVAPVPALSRHTNDDD